jgi:hypothetical protein
MLPCTVGEWKKLLANLPDTMPFELEVQCFGGIGEIKLEVEYRQVGYDGTKSQPRKADVLVLSVEVDG